MPVESAARQRRPRPTAAALGERRRALGGASARFPAKQRTAVYCRSVLGMPYDELAELLESLGGGGAPQRARRA